MKISRKLTIGFLAVAALIWAVGFYAVGASRRSLEDSIIRSSVVLSTHMMDMLAQEIENHIDIFKEYAGDMTLSDALAGSNREFEALVRWQPPGAAIVQPNDFIPVAEETGLIVEIGDWVLHEACRQALAWEKIALKAPIVAVNVSHRQLREKGFVPTVARALEETGLDPRRLDIELTESVLMDDVEDTIIKLRELREMGIRVSIDDFGTGYSSLAYLKRMPIDMLKVDRSFIMDTPDDPDDVAITTAIVGVGHSLGLEVIAEGVETTEQVEFLKKLGCDKLQGYLFSRPLPAEEIKGLLRKGRLAA